MSEGQARFEPDMKSDHVLDALEAKHFELGERLAALRARIWPFRKKSSAWTLLSDKSINANVFNREVTMFQTFEKWLTRDTSYVDLADTRRRLVVFGSFKTPTDTLPKRTRVATLRQMYGLTGYTEDLKANLRAAERLLRRIDTILMYHAVAKDPQVREFRNMRDSVPKEPLAFTEEDYDAFQTGRINLEHAIDAAIQRYRGQFPWYEGATVRSWASRG